MSLPKGLDWSLAAVAACIALGGCGGGGGGKGPGAAFGEFRIGGSTGAFEGTLGLLNNGSDALSLSAPGSFVFAQRVPRGGAYDVQVSMQPPAQFCSVVKGSGKASADVKDVQVQCGKGRLRTVHTFAQGGERPRQLFLGGFAEDAKGYLYAAAAGVGNGNPGAIYRISPQGAVSVLHVFEADGPQPLHRLTFGPDGKLYGVADAEGHDGIVYSLGLDGTFTVLHTFKASEDSVDGVVPSGGLVLAGGSLYGLTLAGGVDDAGTIYRIDADGKYRTLHSFLKGEKLDHLLSRIHRPAGSLTVGSDGMLYGTAMSGGYKRHGGIFRVDPTKSKVETLTEFDAHIENAQTGVVETAPGVFHGVASVNFPKGLALFRLQLPVGEDRMAITNVVRRLEEKDGTMAGTMAYSPFAGAPVLGSDGKLYGAYDWDTRTGQNEEEDSSADAATRTGAIFRYDPKTNDLDHAADFGQDGTTLRSPTNGLLLARNGHLYGVATQATESGMAKALYALD